MPDGDLRDECIAYDRDELQPYLAQHIQEQEAESHVPQNPTTTETLGTVTPQPAPIGEDDDLPF